MKFITFYGWHDASVAGFDGSNIRYFKVERDTGIKHDSFFRGWPPSIPVGSNEEAKINGAIHFIKYACDKWNFKPDAIAFCGFGQCKGENILWEERIPAYGFDVPTFCVDHHYAHALSCWTICNDVEYAVVVDGVGDYAKTHKVIRNPTDIYKHEVIYQTDKPSLSSLLIEAGYRLGLKGMRIDFAGKVMGAQSYGIPQTGKCDYNIDEVNLIDIVRQSNPNGKFGDSEFNDWLATIHEIGISTILNLFKRYCPLKNKVSFSGGCAQNSVLNERLYRIYKENLVIPPHCYDGGLTLGCLEFLAKYYKQERLPVINFPYWQDDEIKENPSNGTMSEVVEMLCENKIVGWFQGRGEIGPRALGNRSILMNPTMENGKNILNLRVKQREHWRPYAASVLETECEKWFDCCTSEFMLRAIRVREDKINLIPSVVHIDNTCRVQTVSQESNELFHKLINSFYKKTGIPMVLNTSLNIGGEPIFSTKQQCNRMIKETGIDAICFGDTIIKSLTYI